jgi:hypothetical protein
MKVRVNVIIIPLARADSAFRTKIVDPTATSTATRSLVQDRVAKLHSRFSTPNQACDLRYDFKDNAIARSAAVRGGAEEIAGGIKNQCALRITSVVAAGKCVQQSFRPPAGRS